MTKNSRKRVFALLCLTFIATTSVAKENRIDFSNRSALMFSAPLKGKSQEEFGSGWTKATYRGVTGEQVDLFPMEAFTVGGVIFQDSYAPQISPSGRYAVLDILRAGIVDPGPKGKPEPETRQYCPVLDVGTGCIVSVQSGDLCGGSWDQRKDLWVVPGYDGDSSKAMLDYQFQNVNIVWHEYLAANAKSFRYTLNNALVSNLGITNLMACQPPAADNLDAYAAMARQLIKDGNFSDARYIDKKLGVKGNSSAQSQGLTISVDKARLYDGPSLSTQTRTYLVKGDRVRVLDKSGADWVKIEYRQSNGPFIEKWIQAVSLE